MTVTFIILMCFLAVNCHHIPDTNPIQFKLDLNTADLENENDKSVDSEELLAGLENLMTFINTTYGHELAKIAESSHSIESTEQEKTGKMKHKKNFIDPNYPKSHTEKVSEKKITKRQAATGEEDLEDCSEEEEIALPPTSAAPSKPSSSNKPNISSKTIIPFNTDDLKSKTVETIITTTKKTIEKITSAAKTIQDILNKIVEHVKRWFDSLRSLACKN